MSTKSTITHEPDPSNPNRTIYTIVAKDQIAATNAIRRLMDLVDVAFDGVPGRARFSHPFWTDDSWHAVGDVEIYEQIPTNKIVPLWGASNVG